MPLDYTQLDQSVRQICRALNAFDGIQTTGSCGGHADPKPYQSSAGRWDIAFAVARGDAGWFALEFLTYVTNNDYSRGGYDVHLSPYAAPPYLNTPGQSLWFALEGGCDPDELAAYLTMRREQHFIAPRRRGRRAPVAKRHPWQKVTTWQTN